MSEESQPSAAPLNRPWQSPWSRMSLALTKLLDRYQPGEGVVMLATALLVGVLAGIGAILFR